MGIGLSGIMKEQTSKYLPYNKALTELARKNRRNPSKAENRIWNDVLRMRNFSQHKFLRQKPIAGYIVDFYCAELCLVIEIDGDSHAETIEYDAERTKVLNALGLSVVRYSNYDVLENIEGVCKDLLSQIQGQQQPPCVPPYQGG
ncbi:MAG: endonuclease domain-containing protein [Thermodesulfovibrionales bacterium]